jgi:hypothetical protein
MFATIAAIVGTAGARIALVVCARHVRCTQVVEQVRLRKFTTHGIMRVRSLGT